MSFSTSNESSSSSSDDKQAVAAGSRNFALIGATGFVAPRHFKAIRDTGNKLVAAVDPHDAAGILDDFFPESRFFTEIERFDRYLEKLRRDSDESPVEFISICSPNYLHDAHVRLALRVKANAICEKPLVISPWNLDQLCELEKEHAQRVYTVLQLRLHPAINALRQSLEKETNRTRRDVCLTYVTRRGPWYQVSWKGSVEKSGGLTMNIGIHFFDLMLWLFGSVQHSEVHLSKPTKMSGSLELDWARVRWFLSVENEDLPKDVRERGEFAYRSLKIDGQEIDMTEGFGDLHTELYRNILAGQGFGIEDARPAIELVHAISNSHEVAAGAEAHPFLKKGLG